LTVMAFGGGSAMGKYISACLFFSAALIAECHAAGLIVFRNGCSASQRIVIAAVGDILFHRPLQRQAPTAKGSYADFWQPVASVIAEADLAYANLDGPAAEGVAGRRTRGARSRPQARGAISELTIGEQALPLVPSDDEPSPGSLRVKRRRRAGAIWNVSEPSCSHFPSNCDV
jgi:hypothetical protein